MAGIVFALTISPLAWSGGESTVHLHVYAAVILGAAIGGFPMFMVLYRPGEPVTSYVIAISQVMYSGLLIHLTGGRIETHFHVFGSLAFLAFYRDPKVLILATVVSTADHFLRGFYFPQSIYGVLQASPWRAVEHAGWILFEDVFLIFSIRNSLKGVRKGAETQVRLEDAIASVELQVQDRTRELVRAQRAVIEHQQAMIASAKMSALGEMAGGIAHEINNPLAVIQSLSEQMVEILSPGTAGGSGARAIDRETLSQMATMVHGTSERIARIVTGLRSFSRDGSRDSFEPVRIRSVIDESLGLCSEKFRSRGVRVTVRDFPSELTLEGRGTQISQVLLNLLNNAFDAVEPLPGKQIWIEVGDLGEEVEIRVRDGGGGIPEDLRRRIFQPFFTTKEIGRGTGLGLSISLGIAQAHGGTLTLDERSENTCFVLRLPKTTERSPRSE